jgi:8-oxo-dGTP pyrophosphatase MutT (NUDIX family)
VVYVVNSPRSHDELAFDRDLPQRLAARLLQPLRGRIAQRMMEPELAYGRHAGPAATDARQAAVVVMLHPREGQWHVPLMVRAETLSHHAGQISLPGGLIDEDESSEEAALRELDEELGVPRFGVLLLGQLTPLYLFNSNFLIAPWVAVVRTAVEFRPSEAEVREILEVPLMHFLDASQRGSHIEERGDVRYRAPHFAWQTHHIWGATSMILAELAAILADI